MFVYIITWVDMETHRFKNIEKSALYCILLVMVCMNFFGRGSIVCLIFGIITMLILKGRLLFDKTSWIVLFFSIVSATFSLYYFGVLEAIKCINYILMYLIGNNLYKRSINIEKTIINTLFYIFLGFSLLISATFIVNYNYLMNNDSRICINIWTGELQAVTFFGMLSSIIIAFSFYGFFLQKKIYIKIITLISFIIMMVVNFETATRTPFLMIIILYIVLLLMFILRRSRNKLKSLLLCLISVFVLVTLFQVDFIGIKTYVMSTALYNRIVESGLNTGRIEIFIEHFKLMFKYPLGGGEISNVTGYLAHNLIQQTHDLYGILATIIIMILFVLFSSNLIKILLIKRKESIHYLIFSFYLVMLIQFMLEPVLTAMPYYLFVFLFIHGITNSFFSNKECKYESSVN